MLHIAARSGNCFVVQFILDHGKGVLNIDAEDYFGNTPLLVAMQATDCNMVRHAYACVVEVLISWGADTKKTNRKNKGPLHYALKLRSYKMTDELVAAQDNLWSEIVDVLRKKDDASGIIQTPLQEVFIKACDDGCYNLAQFLVRKSLVDIQKDPDFHKSGTPLHRAAKNGHEKIVGLLCQHGALLDSRDHKEGYTALHCAILGSGRSFLEEGGNVVNNEHKAHLPIIVRLLQNGASVNACARWPNLAPYCMYAWQIICGAAIA